MQVYKFLARGRRHPFTTVPFPAPGEWVEAGDQCADGPDGVRIATAAHLAHWVNDELWRVEAEGEIVVESFSSSAARARLVAQVDEWDETTGRAFAAACAWRARDAVATRLADADLEPTAAALRELRRLEELATTAAQLSADAAPAWIDPLGLLAEVGDEAEHRRPFTAALTAMVAVAGWDEHRQAVEREWQSAWIVDRLGVRSH